MTKAFPTPALLSRRGETAAQSRVAQSWQARALLATQGNRTKIGTILIAMLGKAASNPPRIVSNAVIDVNGIVHAGLQRKGAANVRDVDIEPLCTAQELQDNFRGLADHLRLNDAERIELFDCLKRWIGKDMRVNPELGDTDDRKAKL